MGFWGGGAGAGGWSQGIGGQAMGPRAARNSDGWDDDYHPVATAAAVTATVAVTSAVVGSIVRSVPPNCVPVSYGGMVYQQCGSTWYQPQYAGSQVTYIVVNPPH